MRNPRQHPSVTEANYEDIGPEKLPQCPKEVGEVLKR